jgi:hypothetical protein
MEVACVFSSVTVNRNLFLSGENRGHHAKPLLGVPVIFAAVSADGDHGYVFVQESNGASIGCLFPDMVDDGRYPCPGTPAIADILQTIGGLAVYAVDSLLTERLRHWNYRRLSLRNASSDGSAWITCH